MSGSDKQAFVGWELKTTAGEASLADFVLRWMTLSKEALWSYFKFLHSNVISEDVQ